MALPQVKPLQWLRGFSVAALGGQDAADVRGLGVAVPVQDRVQVVQVFGGAVAGELALEFDACGVRAAAVVELGADRGPQGGEPLSACALPLLARQCCRGSSFAFSVTRGSPMRPMTR